MMLMIDFFIYCSGPEILDTIISEADNRLLDLYMPKPLLVYPYRI